jgi:hypothetical protein
MLSRQVCTTNCSALLDRSMHLLHMFEAVSGIASSSRALSARAYANPSGCAATGTVDGATLEVCMRVMAISLTSRFLKCIPQEVVTTRVVGNAFIRTLGHASVPGVLGTSYPDGVHKVVVRLEAPGGVPAAVRLEAPCGVLVTSRVGSFPTCRFLAELDGHMTGDKV